MNKHFNSLVKKALCAPLIITLSVTCAAVPSHASLKDSKTAKAISEYSAYIDNVRSGGGIEVLPARPLNTSDLDKKYLKLIKDKIGDGEVTSRLFPLDKTFTSFKSAITAYWSLVRTHTPYIDYQFSCFMGVDGLWRLYLYDSDENRVHYLDASKKYYSLAADGYKAMFKKEIASYESKYGKMSKTQKVAAALNFTAEQLDYRLGWVNHQGKDMYSGGDLYTAYKTGYGVCFDYSNLFYILCRSVGINCVRVAGMISYGAGDVSAGHQWNAVKLGGKYYYVDPANDDRGSSTGINASSHFFSSQLRDLYYSSDVYLVY